MTSQRENILDSDFSMTTMLVVLVYILPRFLAYEIEMSIKHIILFGNKQNRLKISFHMKQLNLKFFVSKFKRLLLFIWIFHILKHTQNMLGMDSQNIHSQCTIKLMNTQNYNIYIYLVRLKE